MSFTLREHTADVAVEATGINLDTVFAAVADGLATAHCESIPDDGDRFSLSVTAESREALLFDYLDSLIYERDVRAVLPVDNETSVREIETDTNTDTDDKWICEASTRGVPLAAINAREIKAVTYSEMDLSETDDGWHAYVVFDV